ncbi:MAG: triple tyrosine motif-containing protein [Verrucomicrobiota bacterium]
MERFAALGGAAAGDVRVIEVGLDGEIWVGTQGAGLGLVKNGQFKSFQAKDGLVENFILSLCCETNGTLWIGTLDMGLCRFQDGQFRTIGIGHGLPANTIYHIEDDQLGNLWFNSPIGVFRISKAQLHACADGDLAKLDVLAYGKAEGMATLAGTGGFTPSGFRAPDGRLWFSTARGIAVINPKAARPNPVRPPVWIEEILVDGQPAVINRDFPSHSGAGQEVVKRSSVVLQPGRRQVDVQFTGLSFTSPERVQFKYRLEGLDPDWMEGGLRRRVTYSFLPPGEYTFHVIACNSDGLWSEAGDSLTIIMLPHFWQTWWFRTGLMVASIAAIAGVFYLESRRRLRRKLERIARERELERERSRIAQDIHDDLGASLTRIGMLSQSAAGDLDDLPRATSSLNQIYDTARDLTRAMDEIVWAVNPRHDTLDSLTNYIARFAHDFLSAAQIRCRLDAPTQVPELTVRSEVRHNLFLAFKETLNNAVKHSGANEVLVTFELRPAGLKLRVSDNGVGFDSNSRRSSAGDRVISGYGIAGIHRRLEQIGGKVEIVSTLGLGTRVELFVPLTGLPAMGGS